MYFSKEICLKANFHDPLPHQHDKTLSFEAKPCIYVRIQSEKTVSRYQ